MSNIVPQFKCENVLNYNTLYDSLEDCKKGKLWKNSVIEFDQFSDFFINDILRSIYGPNKFYFNDFYHTVIIERGKERLICSLFIRDRVIQKAINQNFILPAYTPRIIYDNCASIKDRGIDFALSRLHCFIEKEYRKYGKNFYFLKMDIKSYFDSISHQRCYDLMNKFTTDERLLGIFSTLFNKYKYDTWIHNGTQDDFGIGLGGEIPQSFGIIFLDELDHICKEVFHIQFYIRYMDDIIIIHHDREFLINLLNYISNYLSSIGLRLNENKSYIVNANQGVKFLKFHYYLSDSGIVYMKADKKGVKREIRKLNKLEELLESGIIKYSDILVHYNSYKGHLSRGDSYQTINHLDQLYNELFIYNLDTWDL